VVNEFREFVPAPGLRPFVECLWVHRVEGPPPPEGRRLLPDGRISLAWISGIGVRIAGPQTRYLTPPQLGHAVAFGASFHPGTAPQLLRTRAAELRDQHVQLDAIAPGLARRLDARLGEAQRPDTLLRAFSEELTLALRAVSDPDPAVQDAVRAINDGDASVADAAASAFVSERELQRRFADHIGYGPKTLQRVLRFQRFMRLISARGVNLAAAAARAGYADQPHLNREARRLAGLTPRQLLSWQR
jgi:AraC-like DNA-binding protein